MNVEVILLAVLFLLALWLMYRRNRDRVFSQRAAMFRECLPLMQGHQVLQGDAAFPSLTGTYKGHSVRIEAVPDSLGYRKVPSLWLSISVKRPLRLGGVFDLLVRPQNTEFYSPADGLAHAVDVPPGWPQHASVRVDCLDWNPPMALLDPHVRELFADPRAKELLVAPQGARIVYQTDQARRDRYLVLRQQEFESLTVTPALMSKLLDRAVAVCEDLARSARPQRLAAYS